MSQTVQIIVASLVLLAAVSTCPALAGSKVCLGSHVAVGRQVSMDQIDHAAWNVILRKYVDDSGMVAYRDLHASRGGQLAFWINAYNAVTLRGILQEYPTTSIRNHTAKLLGYNIWKDLQLYSGGQPHSLEQIEHEILPQNGRAKDLFCHCVCINRLVVMLAYHLVGPSAEKIPPSAVETWRQWDPSETEQIHPRREPAGWVFGRVMGFQGADKPLLPRQTLPTPMQLPPSSSMLR